MLLRRKGRRHLQDVFAPVAARRQVCRRRELERVLRGTVLVPNQTPVVIRARVMEFLSQKEWILEGARTWHESDGKASGWLAEELGAVDSCSQVVPCEASADPEVPGSILSAWFSWDIFVGALAAPARRALTNPALLFARALRTNASGSTAPSPADHLSSPRSAPRW